MQNQNKKNKITSLLQSMFILQQKVENLLLTEVGIGLSAYRILSAIDDRLPVSQRKIAVELHQTEANISRQIRQMADQGLVKIAPDRKDRRQRNISRTTKGQRLYSQAEKLLLRHEASIKL